MKAETVKTDVGTVEEEMNNAEDSFSDTEGDLSEEYRMTVEKLKGIMVEGRIGEVIMFKIMDKKVLKTRTDRVNGAIRYFKSKSIAETKNLIRAASVWVAERIRLKKAEQRKKQ